MRLPSVLTTYTLSSLIGGAFAWNLYKKGGVWRLMIYVYLLSTVINMVISAMWYVMYAQVFPVSLYFQSVLYWLLCSLLPTIICVWSCKSRLKLWKGIFLSMTEIVCQADIYLTRRKNISCVLKITLRNCVKKSIPRLPSSRLIIPSVVSTFICSSEFKPLVIVDVITYKLVGCSLGWCGHR